VTKDAARHLFNKQRFGKDIAGSVRAFKQAQDPRPAWVRELLERHSPAAPPPESGLPVVTPETWARRDCRCGTCGVCDYYAAIEAEAFWRPWQDRKRPPELDRPRFAGTIAALTSYVEHLTDGYPSGSLGESLDRIGRHGCRVQNAHRGGSAAQHAAEDVAAVDQALALCFGADNDRGIGAEACRAILLARVVGRDVVVKGRDGRAYRKREAVEAAALAEHYGLTVGAVGGVVKSGMRRLRVELAARGLAPMPKREAGLHEAVQIRRGQILRGGGE
jgi:hypothetical protein